MKEEDFCIPIHAVLGFQVLLSTTLINIQTRLWQLK